MLLSGLGVDLDVEGRHVGVVLQQDLRESPIVARGAGPDHDRRNRVGEARNRGRIGGGVGIEIEL